MKIDSIMPSEIARDLVEMRGPSLEIEKGGGFSSFLEKSIQEVNELMKSADTKGAALATGKSENLHEAMISFEKAETALKLLVQVRNRAIEAYHEVMRMQV